MLKKKPPPKDIYPSREVLLAILDAMFDELYVLDSNNVCIYVNRASERHYNRTPEQLIGQNLLDAVHSGYWSPGIGVIAAHEKRTATYEMMSNTGKKLMVTATPVLDKQGRVEMIVENIRDVNFLINEQTDIETTKRLFTKYYTYEEPPELKSNLNNIVAHSPGMRETLALAALAAKSSANILFSGPTGCGKSLLARFVHESSPAREGPFITVNCSAIPEQLFESELFGYAHGAFSGASTKGKKGIVSLAEGGSLFLDEVNSIPYYLQSKILHFLQERTYAPVGSNKIQHSTCRILAASNQDLRLLAKRREFRSDLYYRLSVLEIPVLGLDDRREDIPGLIEHFLAKLNARMQTNCRLSPEALDFLSRRSWPGNVRELENCLERLTALSLDEVLDLETVKKLMPALIEQDGSPAMEASDALPSALAAELEDYESLDQILGRVERSIVEKAWQKGRSSYAVARLLGVSQNRAYRLIKKYLPADQRNNSGRS